MSSRVNEGGVKSPWRTWKRFVLMGLVALIVLPVVLVLSILATAYRIAPSVVAEAERLEETGLRIDDLPAAR